MSRLPSVCLPGLDPYLACSPRSRHGVKSSRDLVLPTWTPLGPEPTHQLKKKKRKESNRQGRGTVVGTIHAHTCFLRLVVGVYSWSWEGIIRS